MSDVFESSIVVLNNGSSHVTPNDLLGNTRTTVAGRMCGLLRSPVSSNLLDLGEKVAAEMPWMDFMIRQVIRSSGRCITDSMFALYLRLACGISEELHNGLVL